LNETLINSQYLEITVCLPGFGVTEYKPWRVRCLPGFYLIGTAKSGTTDFFARLVQHPLIFSGAGKELHWWSRLRFNMDQPGPIRERQGSADPIRAGLRFSKDQHGPIRAGLRINKDQRDPIRAGLREYVDMFDEAAEQARKVRCHGSFTFSILCNSKSWQTKFSKY